MEHWEKIAENRVLYVMYKMGCKIYSYSIEGGIEFAKQQLTYDNL